MLRKAGAKPTAAKPVRRLERPGLGIAAALPDPAPSLRRILHSNYEGTVGGYLQFFLPVLEVSAARSSGSTH